MPQEQNGGRPWSAGHVVALGGGGFSEGDDPLLDDYILALSPAPRPKVCFLATASFDSAHYIDRFRQSFANRNCRTTHIQLLPAVRGDPAATLADQDVIYVGGGHSVVMLSTWLRHGIDHYLRAAWKRGAVLCGISAGAMCWFEAGITGVVDPPRLSPLKGCLNLLAGSFCPHYDRPERRGAYLEMVKDGHVPSGWAADGGVALHFCGRELVEVVAALPGASAFRVGIVGGEVEERPLPVRLLVPGGGDEAEPEASDAG